MYHKGEYVAYGINGVCQVGEVTTLNLDQISKDRKYYVLYPRNNGGKVYVPVDKADSKMRRILTREEALIVQLSIVVIIAVNNNLLTKYGYGTIASTGQAFGAVIPLAVVGIILTCYIKSAAIILQSMGNSAKSTILALLRDVLVFVPASIILAMISKNIVTMLWAAVISDVAAAIVGFFFLRTEIHKLSTPYY